MAAQKGTSTSQQGLSELETQRVRLLFEQIAEQAFHAGRIIFHSPNPHEIAGSEPNAESEKERLWIAIEDLRGKLATIGILADLGAGKVGGTQMGGGIEGWLLPAAYTDLDLHSSAQRAQEVGRIGGLS
jgi:hypothetical protein